MISDDSLRKKIIYLFEDGYPYATMNMENDETMVHRTLLLPLFSKLFLVEEEANQLDLARAFPVDYGQLLENHEFLTVLKLTANKRKQSLDADRRMYAQTVELIRLIEEELVTPHD